jgi:hypothetical protein
MEEQLRNYFLKAGYYVIRGVPFIYENFEVTDIDLWLYGRASSVSREVTIVDAKNKRTPQAIERIFWIQGLKKATKANNAIVATTDKRQEVKDFGRDLDIFVLDGVFLDKLKQADKYPNSRLQEEEFINLIESYSLNKLDGDWKGRYRLCKSFLAEGLSFDNCNKWLPEAKFFAEQIITNSTQREIALRCLFIICSFIAIAVDFLLKDFSFFDLEERKKLIKDGFTYGSKGRSGMQNVLDVAMGLVEQNSIDGKSIANQVKQSFEHKISLLPTDILGEYFSSIEVSKSIFLVAKELENLGMQRKFTSYSQASIETRSFILCLLDYWNINRSLFNESINID